MAVEKTDIEQGLANLLKVARTVIRVKHSIAADEELNKRLPGLERAYKLTVAIQGELPSHDELVDMAREALG